MQLTIVFRHLDPNQAVKNHVEEKIGKLSRFFQKEPVKIHVVIAHERFLYLAEATVAGNHISLVCVEESEDIYTAIDQMVHKLERQIQRHKEKVKNHKNHRGVTMTNADLEENTPFL